MPPPHTLRYVRNGFHDFAATYRIIFWFAGTINSIHARYFWRVTFVTKLSVGIQH
jgi:hypothetical protein